jgi:hypothetical protein
MPFPTKKGFMVPSMWQWPIKEKKTKYNKTSKLSEKVAKMETTNMKLQWSLQFEHSSGNGVQNKQKKILQHHYEKMG